ncbi:Stp1/IreP family PP2C-type Ser/Thr phosphatase [Lyngbya confervoides]|uniref:Stp1/IreP family PP2C-type Ser/Thr phosphatase n=1 Tax=Lyngbya confervoides BDU141951 TaxID=1574623 RepID=A0ABD4SYX0_9CYAN|nr:Stp1/IreP family PP2C-type Ser/Thr phosphatase [Lyngbya confervoides]MCM1981473.1 Stp1/IreP family PP2C-type Ser/Thr phosphatase [Lyngbya confervoides BDU141951]
MERLFAGLSDTGVVRKSNQDAYHIDKPAGRFVVVADGMGGHAGGQEASQIATQAIRQYLETSWGESVDPEALLREALVQANQSILENQKEHPERSDMGTTVVVVIFPENESPWCAHVGDSRLYRYRNEELVQLTEDHTWIAQAISAGMLDADQAREHPWRHVLAQCLGREDLSRIDIQPIDLQAGDRLLLCSDGLTEELSDDLILKYLNATVPLEEASETLVEAAKEEGGQDNITVILVESQHN